MFPFELCATCLYGLSALHEFEKQEQKIILSNVAAAFRYVRVANRHLSQERGRLMPQSLPTVSWLLGSGDSRLGRGILVLSR